MTNDLAKLDGAVKALAEAKTLPEIKNVHDTGKAFLEYAKAADLGLEAQNHAAIITALARRKGGEVLRNIEPSQGERNDLTSSKPWTKLPTKQQTIENAGMNRATAHNWEKESKIPEETLNDYFQEKIDKHEQITFSGIRKLDKPAHVSHNSGENEWYTPAKYIEAARAVMGGIDLDPASSDIANQTVKAKTYYTIEDDGLSWDWNGRIWMNPPYAQPLITHFCDKLTTDIDNGFITEAVTLTNNATETNWYRGMSARCAAVCFIQGRIKFIDQKGNPGSAPLQGQHILYFGSQVDKFASIFKEFGQVFYATR